MKKSPDAVCENRVRSKSAPMEQVALAFSAIFTLGIIVWFLWLMRFGIDFADEGYYLNWISNPGKYKSSLTQFGFIYHPLFKVASGDIAVVRQLNLLITILLAFFLVYSLLGVIYGKKLLNYHVRLVVAAAISVSALLFYRNWIPTPSYNSLAFQSLLLGVIGILLAHKGNEVKSALGWLLLGFSGWLAFMAKPSTAAVFALISLVFLLISKRFNPRYCGISALFVLTLFVVFAIYIDGSVSQFYYRIQSGVSFAHMLSPDYSVSSLLRFDSFYFLFDEMIYFLAAMIGVALLYFMSRARRKLVVSLWLVTIIALSFLVFFALLLSRPLFENRLWVHLLVLAFPCSALLIASTNRTTTSVIIDRIKGCWKIVLCIFLIPYAFAFGTGGNYWFFYGLVSVFWVAACLVLIEPTNERGEAFPILSFSMALQLAVPLIILTAIEDPYYQPGALLKSDYEVDFGYPDSKLKVPNSFGLYVSQAAEISKRAGFIPGTPMIDLTGRSPGLLYALSASSVGSAWIYGNYINTRKEGDKYAIALLEKVSCDELARAWILVEPNGQVGLSMAVLNSFGANAATDYESVGAFLSPNSAGGFRANQQMILKPKRELFEANSKCLSHRSALEAS
jgi:hypothetical protein